MTPPLRIPSAGDLLHPISASVSVVCVGGWGGGGGIAHQAPTGFMFRHSCIVQFAGSLSTTNAGLVTQGQGPWSTQVIAGGEAKTKKERN